MLYIRETRGDHCVLDVCVVICKSDSGELKETVGSVCRPAGFPAEHSHFSASVMKFLSWHVGEKDCPDVEAGSGAERGRTHSLIIKVEITSCSVCQISQHSCSRLVRYTLIIYYHYYYYYQLNASFSAPLQWSDFCSSNSSSALHTHKCANMSKAPSCDRQVDLSVL